MRKSKILIIVAFIMAFIQVGYFFYSGDYKKTGNENDIRKQGVTKFKKTKAMRKGGPKANPNAHVWGMRAYPNADVDMKIYRKGMKEANELKIEALAKKDIRNWELVGPTNVGGRISDIVIDLNNEDIVWAAAATGGVWKSLDKGETWEAKFDDMEVMSMGAIALDPNNSDILYAGTGEAAATSLSFYGNGMYKTLDGGTTWENIGLINSSYISRIRVDKNNSNIVYACATGKMYTAEENRGVYKSVNGGETWDKILFVSDSTAANDIVIDPFDSQILYASMWERIRTLDGRMSGGANSGIFKSIDGGDSWNKLTNGFPNDATVGRIGLAISEQTQGTVYAVYQKFESGSAPFGGVYKTTNGGDSWTQLSSNGLTDCYSSFGWYFSKIEVDPKNDQKVYILGVSYHRSDNGGNSWTTLGNYSFGPHVDHHAIAISPTENFFIEGNDGGIVTSTTEGSNYEEIKIPITQFYGFTVDDNNSDKMIGGTQDNGTWLSRNGNLGDWEHVIGGDGFQSLISPANTNIMYGEWQNGGMNKSVDNGYSFYGIYDGLYGGDRFNWNTPLIFHPTNSDLIYCASQYVYKSDDAASTNYSFYWEKISGDLTGGIGTITTVAAAPTDEEVIYAGTDHSDVWVTQNGGSDWTNISSNLPNRWVTRIVVDYSNPAIAFVSFSGLRWDSDLRYIFKTDDFGATWTDITGNLPNLPINCIEVNKDDNNLLYVGSDIGAYYTTNGGENWSVMALGLPNTPVFDIKVHYADELIFVATYGRGAYKIPFSGLVSSIDDNPEIASYDLKISNYPNPFNNSTIISIKSSLESDGKVYLYNVAGRKIATLFDGKLNKGLNKITFDAGELKLASGVYVCKVVAKDNVWLHRVNFTK